MSVNQRKNEKRTSLLGATGLKRWSSSSFFGPDAQVPSPRECSFCLLLIRTLERLLPKERTEVSHTCPAGTNPRRQGQLTGLFIPSRPLSSTCWRRFATSCRPPTTFSVRLWLASSAGRCWMPSSATPPRRPSAPSSRCVKGRGHPW